MITPLEHVEQTHFTRWMAFQYPDVPYCSQVAGANLSLTARKKAKSQGYKKGFPDISILKATKKFFGLFIEMKRVKGGTTSKEQKEWIQKLNAEGYYACVCKGFDEARKVVEKYLRNEL